MRVVLLRCETFIGIRRLYSSKANEYLSQLVNYEKQGIPKLAGTSSSKHFDLSRMKRLLKVLNNPQDDFRAIHIAGSKGKGSTAIFLSNILTNSGLKVGLYTSPHLTTIRERININKKHISEEELEQLVKRFEGVVREIQEQENGALSHFEVLTALAYRYYADNKVDLAVIEAGLGGLTDATNVFAAVNLEAAVITSLGHEHVEALGGNLEAIAAAKAGILKPNRPVVLSRQVYDTAERVVLQHAKELGCAVIRPHELVQVHSHGLALAENRQPATAVERLIVTVRPDLLLAATLAESSMTKAIRVGSGLIEDVLEFSEGRIHVSSRLVGRHQRDNLSTAVATSLLMWRQGWPLSLEAIRRGINEAFLPGRFEVVPMPAESEYEQQDKAAVPLLVLDGAHTGEAAAALSETMGELLEVVSLPSGTPAADGAGLRSKEGETGGDASSSSSSRPPIILVVAMAQDKLHREVMAALRRLQPQVALFTSVPISGSFQRTASPGLLLSEWRAAATHPSATACSANAPFEPPHLCREMIQANLRAALLTARHELRAFPGRRGVVLVTGSLHAVAEARELCGVTVDHAAFNAGEVE